MQYELRPEERQSISSFLPGRKSIVVFADDPLAIAAATNACRHAGADPLIHPLLDSASAFAIEPPPGDASLIEVTRDFGAPLERFLEHMERHSRGGAHPVIINAVPECVDLVAGFGWGPNTTLLCRAGAEERITAITLAKVGALAMRNVDTDALRIQHLADEVARIAKSLTELASQDAPRAGGFSDGMIGYRAQPLAPEAEEAEPISAGDVRRMIRLRRMRDRYLGEALFADPAWDMLLDLMAARLERLRVAVSSLCIAAAVPPTTALRWIKTMTEVGVFVRVADPSDGRRVFIELSEAAARSMEGFLSTAQRQGATVV